MIKRICRVFVLIPVLMFFVSRTYADTAVYTYDSLNRLVRADYGDGAYAEYIYDDTGNMTRKILQEEPPFMVKLAEFRTDTEDGCVLLTWKTLSETDNAGFHILRSDTEKGKYARITALMISSQGEATQGASYSYRDCGVSEGRTYYYRLEDVDYKGVSRYDGPVSPFPAGTSQGVNTAYLRDVILILQINAGMEVSAPANMDTYAGNDGKAGMEDAVRLLHVISGLRKWGKEKFSE